MITFYFFRYSLDDQNISNEPIFHDRFYEELNTIVFPSPERRLVSQSTDVQFTHLIQQFLPAL